MIIPEPIDYLPYVDGSVSEAETAAIERLISQDLSRANLNQLHPQVDQLLPLSSRPSLQAFDLEDPEEVPQLQAISLERYTNWEGEPQELEQHQDQENQEQAQEQPQSSFFDRMYTTLSYSVLRDRNAQVQAQSSGETEKQAQVNESVRVLGETQHGAAERKRQRVDEIHEQRQAKQSQFLPVQGYLESRWKDGVRNMVDMGIGRPAH